MEKLIGRVFYSLLAHPQGIRICIPSEMHFSLEELGFFCFMARGCFSFYVFMRWEEESTSTDPLYLPFLGVSASSMHWFLVMSSLEEKFPGRLWQFWVSAATILSIFWWFIVCWNLPWLVSHQPYKLEKGTGSSFASWIAPGTRSSQVVWSGVPSQWHIQAGALAQGCSMAVESWYSACLQTRTCWQLSWRCRQSLIWLLSKTEDKLVCPNSALFQKNLQFQAFHFRKTLLVSVEVAGFNLWGRN